MVNSYLKECGAYRLMAFMFFPLLNTEKRGFMSTQAAAPYLLKHEATFATAQSCQREEKCELGCETVTFSIRPFVSGVAEV